MAERGATIGQPGTDAPRQIVRDARWRLQRAWLADGLDEISGGNYGLLLAAAFGAIRHNVLWFLALLPLQLVGLWLQFRVLRLLKARLVDHRAGYVRPRLPDWLTRRSGRFWVGYVVACMVAGGALGGVDLRPWGRSPFELISAFFFLVSVLMPLFAAWKTRIWRFALYTPLPLAAAIAAILAGADQTLVFAVWLATFSLLAVILGSLAFHAFLRANPADGNPALDPNEA